jgi:hypothetical protein
MGWGEWWGQPWQKNLKGVIMGGKMNILNKTIIF